MINMKKFTYIYFFTYYIGDRELLFLLPASSTEEVLQLEESLAVESTKTDYVSQVFYLCIF